MSLLLLCFVASVHDGDSIACRDGTKLRLAAIDAPEVGRCQRGRTCAPGDPVASRDALRARAGISVRYRVVDANLCTPGFQRVDPYGRVVARVFGRDGDLSRAQLAGGFAIPWRCKGRGR